MTATMVARRFLAGSRWVVTSDLLGTTLVFSQGFTLDSYLCFLKLRNVGKVPRPKPSSETLHGKDFPSKTTFSMPT